MNPAKKNVKKNDKKKLKKIRVINFKKVLIFLLGVYLLFSFIVFVINIPIKNIFIYNNTFFSDQKIIEIAGISNYPSVVKTSSKNIKKKLLKEELIKDVIIKKKNFIEIHIEIIENRPIFYNKNTEKTILLDKKEVKNIYSVPTLINYVPDTIYQDFIDEMIKIDSSILKRISEIEYAPNEVDETRFLLYMNDNNYVYLTIGKFTNINSYVSIMENIIAKFGEKKGILHLDSGGYFDLFK